MSHTSKIQRVLFSMSLLGSVVLLSQAQAVTPSQTQTQTQTQSQTQSPAFTAWVACVSNAGAIYTATGNQQAEQQAMALCGQQPAATAPVATAPVPTPTPTQTGTPPGSTSSTSTGTILSTIIGATGATPPAPAPGSVAIQNSGEGQEAVAPTGCISISCMNINAVLEEILGDIGAFYSNYGSGGVLSSGLNGANLDGGNGVAPVDGDDGDNSGDDNGSLGNQASDPGTAGYLANTPMPPGLTVPGSDNGDTGDPTNTSPIAGSGNQTGGFSLDGSSPPVNQPGETGPVVTPPQNPTTTVSGTGSGGSGGTSGGASGGTNLNGGTDSSGGNLTGGAGATLAAVGLGIVPDGYNPFASSTAATADAAAGELVGSQTNILDAALISDICGGTCGARAVTFDNLLANNSVVPLVSSNGTRYSYTIGDFLDQYGNYNTFSDPSAALTFMEDAKPGASFLVTGFSEGSNIGHVVNAQVMADGTVMFRDPSFPGWSATESITDVFSTSVGNASTFGIVDTSSPVVGGTFTINGQPVTLSGTDLSSAVALDTTGAGAAADAAFNASTASAVSKIAAGVSDGANVLGLIYTAATLINDHGLDSGPSGAVAAYAADIQEVDAVIDDVRASGTVLTAAQQDRLAATILNSDGQQMATDFANSAVGTATSWVENKIASLVTWLNNNSSQTGTNYGGGQEGNGGGPHTTPY